MRIAIVILIVGWIVPSSALAELSVPNFFSDHMVIQRDGPVRVWGNADPGARVSVSFKSNTSVAEADETGKWRVSIQAGPADAKAAQLKIVSGKEVITVDDVLVGEVWFASGQSNMVFTMDRVPAYAALIEQSNHPQIRMFNAAMVTAVEPREDIDGQWTLCGPETVPKYSAVAFFFAKKLHAELGIPVGVIKSAWGGKPIETFTSREALRSLSDTKKLVDDAVAADATFDPKRAASLYKTRLEKWEVQFAAWRKKPAAERGRRPRKPQPPKRPLDTEGRPGVLFNSMIHPFVGYGIRGAIWYQGEGNAKPGAAPYDRTLALLINDWRTRWGDDFSFYFVQLANFRKPATEPGNNDPWPLLQDRMRRVLDTTAKTGMAVINDIGEAKDIHPKNKRDVGERLARWALAKDYDRQIVYSGPLYRSSDVEDGVVRVTFDHFGTGLKSRNGEALARFEIAGADKVWHWADAKIAGSDEVIVSSDEVAKPVAVRYAWAANPKGANLVNSEGLPASVFRSDMWDDVLSQVNSEARGTLQQRRALGVEIRDLAAKKAQLKRGTPEFKAIAEKQRVLMRKFRALNSATPK